MTDADFRDLFARLEQPVEPRPEFAEQLLREIDDIARGTRAPTDAVGARARGANEPDGAAGHHGYLAEKEDHPMFTFTGTRARRSGIIVALAVAALIAVVVAVVTRSSTSNRLKVVPTAPTPTTAPIAPAAQPQLFIGGQFAIVSVNLDGKGDQHQLVTGLDTVCDVAVDHDYIYWVDDQTGTVERAKRDGTGVNTAFITGTKEACGIALDRSYIYWANAGSGIGRANLDGTGVNQSFITGAMGPCGVAVDGAHIYWANAGGTTIGRANLDGSGVNQNFITGLASPCNVAVDGAHIYWGDGASAIGRANLDGTGVNRSFITGGDGRAYGFALDGTYLYWANSGVTQSFANSATGTTIGRAKLDGTDVEQNFIGGIDHPSGVAIGR